MSERPRFMRSTNAPAHLRKPDGRAVCKRRPPSAGDAGLRPSADQSAASVPPGGDHQGADGHDSSVLTSEEIRQLGKLILERELLLRTRMCMSLQARVGDDGADPVGCEGNGPATVPAGAVTGTLTQVIEELLEIEAAKENLKNRAFGFCVMCHGPIGFNRLLALPTVQRCLSCQEDYEYGSAWRSSPLH